MAMMLHAFLGNFSRLLTKMAEEEVGMLLGVPNEIVKLRRTVHDIQCVLADAEMKQTKGSAIEQWLLQLKDVMYDADDLMDLCQIKAGERSACYGTYLSASKFSCGINMLSCYTNPKFAHNIGTKIKKVNSRLDEISNKMSMLGLLRDVGEPSNVCPGQDFILVTDSIVGANEIVGDKIEEDTALLVKFLTTEDEVVNENVSVVAVVGMPGIGKTTLAKKVFHDPEVSGGFNLKLWVCVSKDIKWVKLLKCIIREAGGNHGAAEERSELVPMLARLVQGKKFFLVLDDVWPESQEVWNGLLRNAMSGGARGSRLLVTTRDHGVAGFINATTTHCVKSLSAKDSWSLLVKQVALDENESKVLKDIGFELAKKCNGLPLAIREIGGVLRRRGKNITEWQSILKSPLWSLNDLPPYFPHAFYLSYEDLPSHLKQCFLFCSLYPEDFELFRTDLIYLWLAEGILCDEGDLSFYKLGMEYYNELILRNILEVHGMFYDQWVCKMHDMMRSFAGYLRNNDSLIVGEEKLPDIGSLLKVRRLSIERSVVDSDLDFLKNKKFVSPRMLLLINSPMGDVLSKTLLSFSHLRIVVLSYSNVSILSDSFCALIQLRYLDLFGSKLETLSNSICQLKKLVYLNLGECNQLSHVPSSIVNLHELRFLCFYNTNIEVFPAGLRKLTKLVQLIGFKPDDNRSRGHSSLDDLGTLSQLSRLSLYSLEKAYDITVAKETNLKAKIFLKHLRFFYTPNQGCQVSKPTEEKQSVEDILNALSPPPSLEILFIEHYYGNKLPIWLHVGPSKLQFLRYLKISECECFSQLPPLGQLPNLDYLRIIGAISVVRIRHEFLFDDSNDHNRLVVSQYSIIPFVKLNRLVFIGMSSWVEWLWEESQPAMPQLKKLSIKSCPGLKSLPKGLSCQATSLEYLELNASEQLKSIEDLPTVKELRVMNNPNLERISNLPNLSLILIQNCPNLVILENLKPRHRMELIDYQMKTLPEYLRKAKPEKLIVWCAENLFLTVTSLGLGNSERQKFEHIPIVKMYPRDESLYATFLEYDVEEDHTWNYMHCMDKHKLCGIRSCPVSYEWHQQKTTSLT